MDVVLGAAVLGAAVPGAAVPGAAVPGAAVLLTIMGSNASLLKARPCSGTFGSMMSAALRLRYQCMRAYAPERVSAHACA